MTFKSTEVGEKLKVWSVNGAKPAPGGTCVISSHGGQAPKQAVFKVPNGVTLYFYGPEGGAVKSDIFQMVQGKYVPFETIVGDGNKLCRDYELTRFQGEQHGGGKEDYEYIKNGMHPDFSAQQMEQQVQAGLARWTPAQIASIRNNVRVIMDVVTVRNRSGVFALLYQPPNLSEAIKILQDNGWNYTHIHCSFCRFASAIGSAALKEGSTVFTAKLR